MPFADVDDLIVTWLPTVGISATTITTDDVLRMDLAYAMPLIQVVTYGGTDRAGVLDDVNLDIDVYAATRDMAVDLAEEIRTAVLDMLPGYHVPGATVAKTRTSQRPAWRPYDNTAIRRRQAAYTITVHAS
jgi:hypothetical protein